MAKSKVQSADRIIGLVDSMQPKWRARFLAVVKTIKDQLTLNRIEQMIVSGNIEDAIVLSETAALQLGRVWSEGYILAGDDAGKFVSGALNLNVNFDTMNVRALNEMRNNQLRMVRGFTQQQRAATNQALQSGIQRGIGPRAMAREFKDTIGLTDTQAKAVDNYRAMLEGTHPRGVKGGLKESLNRKLRDGRWNATVERAIKDGTQIPQKTIDKMVDRYRQRYLKYRSEVIARTEALRSVHAGTDEMYQQAIDNGTLNPSKVIRTWDTSRDNRVRTSHRPMQGQKRSVGQSFITGAGNAMRYPGDPQAPPSESVQDRCAIATRILP